MGGRIFLAKDAKHRQEHKERGNASSWRLGGTWRPWRGIFRYVAFFYPVVESGKHPMPSTDGNLTELLLAWGEGDAEALCFFHVGQAGSLRRVGPPGAPVTNRRAA